MMTPMPNTEHQCLVARLTSILLEVVGGPELGIVCPGVNLSHGNIDDWTQDYRVPDVAVLLHDGPGEDCDTHWCGGVDFLIEVTSPDDRTREKIPFYSRLGVAELLLVDRQSWTLELYRQQAGQLTLVGRSHAEAPDPLASNKVPLTFQLVSADPRPQIQVKHVGTGRNWLV
ncbi:MAG: hypothetical protein A2V70_13230 [Planctomycetes bacterium RBG_13_63_9]|nr:MAG: hypothetical protein A2V70_13230 [Planctomycetes bacterium RBG_13_63_9]